MTQGRNCNFWADETDLAELLEEFAQLGPFKYVQVRSEIDRPNAVFTNPVQLLPFATVTSFQPERKHSFLVLAGDQEIRVREIRLQDGSGVRRIADQNQNWDSVVFALGGDAGDRTLVMSDINTAGDTEKAIEMHQKYKKLVLSRTRKLGKLGAPYRLMAGAISKLKAGWRLAQGKGYDPSTDVKIPESQIARL